MASWFNLRKGEEDSTDPSAKFIEKKESVRTSEELLEEYHEHRQEWAKQVQDDDEFRNNNQISDELKIQLQQLNQSPASFNIIHPTVELAKQMLTENQPKFQTAAREDSDVESARYVSDLLTYIWQNSEGNAEFARNVDDFYVRSMGVLMGYVDPHDDYGRGEVKIKAIDPLKLYIDPNSQDRYARDASHLMIHELMTAEQIQQFEPYVEDFLERATPSNNDRQPNISRQGTEDQQVGPNHDQHDEYYEVIDRYSKVKKSRFHVKEVDSGHELEFTEEEFDEYKKRDAVVVTDQIDGRQITVDDDEVAQLMEQYAQTGGVFHYIQGPGGQPVPVPGEPTPEALPNSRVEIEPTTIGDVIDEVADVNEVLIDRVQRVMSVGGVEVTNTILEISEYPIVPCMNRHNRNPYPLSDVRFVKGLQKHYNKLKSDILAHLSNSKSIKVAVPRGTDRDEVEKHMNKAGTSVFEYDPDITGSGAAGIVQMQPAPLANEIYLEPERIKQEVQRIFGVYDLSGGNPANAPETVRGTVMMDEFGQRTISNKMKALYTQLNIVGKVCLQLAQKTYTEEKVIRIFQPNMDPRETVINQPIYHEFRDEVIDRHNDITVGKYDVQVLSGSTLPNSRWGRFEYYKELYQMGVIDQLELLKQTDVADIEGVMNRSSQMAQMKKMIEQQQEEIKKLKGDLQTADREAKHANKKAELQKFKANLEGQEVRAEKETELFKQRLQDKTKDMMKDDGGEAQSSPTNGVQSQ